MCTSQMLAKGTVVPTANNLDTHFPRVLPAHGSCLMQPESPGILVQIVYFMCTGTFFSKLYYFGSVV